MRFTKMQGLGNDYLYVYAEAEPQAPEALSVRWSDRHFGVGSDGMIWILPSAVADWKMRIFNADGSEAKMCGNGIRCVGKYLFDRGHTDRTTLTIETLSGIKTLRLAVEDGRVQAVTVEMGEAVVGAPMALALPGQTLTCTPVSTGNPHAVTFVPDADAFPLAALGEAVSCHAAFPGGVNAEFVSLAGENHLRMRVWERGSGITMACGTGACASAAAAVAAGLCRAGEEITVTLDGGDLRITVSEAGQVTMTGPAAFVSECETAE